jgi:hypothetical protein
LTLFFFFQHLLFDLLELNFLIYFNMGSMKLLASHVLDCKFQKLTLINQGYQENNRTHNVMRIKKTSINLLQVSKLL